MVCLIGTNLIYNLNNNYYENFKNNDAGISLTAGLQHGRSKKDQG
jgi:hypothetical protein